MSGEILPPTTHVGLFMQPVPTEVVLEPDAALACVVPFVPFQVDITSDDLEPCTVHVRCYLFVGDGFPGLPPGCDPEACIDWTDKLLYTCHHTSTRSPTIVYTETCLELNMVLHAANHAELVGWCLHMAPTIATANGPMVLSSFTIAFSNTCTRVEHVVDLVSDAYYDHTEFMDPLLFDCVSTGGRINIRVRIHGIDCQKTTATFTPLTAEATTLDPQDTAPVWIWKGITSISPLDPWTEYTININLNTGTETNLSWEVQPMFNGVPMGASFIITSIC